MYELLIYERVINLNSITKEERAEVRRILRKYGNGEQVYLDADILRQYEDTVTELEKQIKQLQLEKVITDSHAPEGRNYTNAQYVDLLMKFNHAKEQLGKAVGVLEKLREITPYEVYWEMIDPVLPPRSQETWSHYCKEEPDNYGEQVTKIGKSCVFCGLSQLEKGDNHG